MRPLPVDTSAHRLRFRGGLSLQRKWARPGGAGQALRGVPPRREARSEPAGGRGREAEDGGQRSPQVGVRRQISGKTWELVNFQSPLGWWPTPGVRSEDHNVQPLPEAGLQQGQDLPPQAQVRARHPAVRAAQEGSGLAERRAGPEAGGAATLRRGAQRLGGGARGGLLQPRQPHLRHHQRRLHRAVLPCHVGRPQVRVPLAGRAQVPQAHGAVRAALHGPAHGLDRGADQQRGHLPHQRGHAVPQELPAGGEEDPVQAVPRVRARLHPPLRPHRPDGLRGARQHLLQALLLLRQGVRAHRHQGAGAAERNDRPDVPLSPGPLSPEQCQGTSTGGPFPELGHGRPGRSVTATAVSGDLWPPVPLRTPGLILSDSETPAAVAHAPRAPPPRAPRGSLNLNSVILCAVSNWENPLHL